MKTNFLYKPFQILSSLLLLIAPVIITDTACLGFWGEPEIPESMKQIN